mmetsp:Transcript_53663/g.116701  ORF Transcript_53663/g.116701 Transcript_53663/m.116701 type:complete len:244 (-) Transcript_53663:291-1022(-)
MFWTLRSIMRRRALGGLNLSPTLLTRALQNLSTGMSGFMAARAIADTPIPFPYAQLVVLLLVMYLLVTPFVMMAFTQNVWFSALISVGATLVYYGLHSVTVELEDPFGTDENDLPLQEMHTAFLESVHYLEHEETEVQEALEDLSKRKFSDLQRSPAAREFLAGLAARGEHRCSVAQAVVGPPARPDQNYSYKGDIFPNDLSGVGALDIGPRKSRYTPPCSPTNRDLDDMEAFISSIAVTDPT